MKWFYTHTHTQSRRYPVETMTDAGYADDLVLLANKPAQAESLQHSLEQVAGLLVSTLTQIKLSSCILNEKDPSPL